jgi:competence protein ComFC
MNFVYRFFTHLCDIVFPPSQDACTVRALDTRTVEKMYVVRSVDGVYVLCSYSNPSARALIHEAKFHHNTKAFELLGVLFSMYAQTVSEPIDIVIPIPLSPARLRARGYNQVHEVLKKASLPTSAQVRTNIVVRNIHTKPQTELKRAERLRNVRNAFGIADISPITGKHILLVDDVMTTGATLRAVKAALLPYSPASVTCVALAH